VLNRTWRAALGDRRGRAAVTRGRWQCAAAEDFAGASLRLPPTVSADSAGRNLKSILESDPPYGARVCFEYARAGWVECATDTPWLKTAVDRRRCPGALRQAGDVDGRGRDDSLQRLGAKFPQAQFLITGVLGPHSNAHGPNEFLHIDYAKRLSACVATSSPHTRTRPGDP
jgi:hypothetical protein